MTILKAMAVAISMYSRIPVPRVEWEEKNMKYAMGFFPAVGVFIGAAEFLAGSLILEYTTAGVLLFAAVMTLIPAFARLYLQSPVPESRHQGTGYRRLPAPAGRRRDQETRNRRTCIAVLCPHSFPPPAEKI